MYGDVYPLSLMLGPSGDLHLYCDNRTQAIETLFYIARGISRSFDCWFHRRKLTLPNWNILLLNFNIKTSTCEVTYQALRHS